MEETLGVVPPRGASPNGKVMDASRFGRFSPWTRLRQRQEVTPQPYRRHHFVAIALFVVAVGLIAPQLVSSRSSQNLLNLWLVYSIAGIGFYWIFGLAGRFAFCQTFMMALGAYTSAWITRSGDDNPVIMGLFGAMIVTAVIALLVGLAVHRASDLYFAIATLSVTQVGIVVFQQWTDFAGPSGTLVGIEPLSAFGREFLTDEDVFWFFLGALGVTLVLAALIERSPLRRNALSVRENAVVSRTLGVRAVWIQLLMFALGSAFGGLSGALIGHWGGIMSVNSFGVTLAIGLLLMLILGGQHSFWGPVIGAGFYVAMPELLSRFKEYQQVIYGVVLLLTIIALPEGIAGIGSRVRTLIRRHQAARKPPEPREEHVTPPLLALPTNGTETVVDARDVSVSFGGVKAVDSVSMTLHNNEILGIVGPNGSGKTTFLNALTGVISARGRITVMGAPLPPGRPGGSRRVGLLRVFQHPQTFTSLSCLENVALSNADTTATGLAASWVGRPFMFVHERRRWRHALDALDYVGLAHLAHLPAGELTYGQQRLLELARAIGGSPRVLLLDEPSAGLNDAETHSLRDLLTRVRSSGVALVVVDHKIDFIDQLCDRVAVLELGHLIALGSPHKVWADPQVIAAYLGVPRDA